MTTTPEPEVANDSSEEQPNMVQNDDKDAPYRILALYKFIPLKNLPKWKQELNDVCRPYGALGTLLIAPEGINGTICYPVQQSSDPILEYLQTTFPNLMTRLSYSHLAVFSRFLVKIKTEIIKFGRELRLEAADSACSFQRTGTYVEPGPDWHCLLEDPNCWVIDTRNEYEIQLGTFRHATNPHTDSFSQLKQTLQPQSIPPHVNKIAMFCTGGVRCEKSTAACLEWNPNLPVYHLKGGILAYLESIPKDESWFEGECYVFDQRVAVQHGLRPSQEYASCFACRRPLSREDRQRPDYQLGISCRHCCHYNAQHKQRLQERHQQRQRQIELGGYPSTTKAC